MVTITVAIKVVDPTQFSTTITLITLSSLIKLHDLITNLEVVFIVHYDCKIQINNKKYNQLRSIFFTLPLINYVSVGVNMT